MRGRGDKWNDTDLERLRAIYPKATSAALEQFAEEVGRSLASVKLRAQKERLSRPSRERVSADELLTAWFEVFNASEVARRCGITKRAALKRLRALGIDVAAAQEARRVWTPREKTYLRRYYKRLPASQIAAKLGKTPEQVRAMARHLGLAETPERTIGYFNETELREVFEDWKASGLSAQNFCALRGYTRSRFIPKMHATFGEEYEAVVEANWPKQTWYVRGRRVELAVRKDLEANGFPHVVRSFRSRGIADLTAVGPGGTLLVQVKRGGYLTPTDHDVLWELALSAGATPLLAGMPDGRKKRYWVLTGRMYEYRCAGGHTIAAKTYAKQEPCPECGCAPERSHRVVPRNVRAIREITLPWSPAEDEKAKAA